MLYQSWFSSASTDPATPLTHSGSTFSFLRGIFFGIVILLSIEAFVVYRFVRLLVDPERRLFKVSQGDRPSFAKDFVGVTGPEGTNADHEVLKEELLDNKHKIPASSAHHVTREHHEPWPENVVEFLRLALTAADGDLPLPPLKNAKGGARSIAGSKLNEPVAMAPVEQCHWVNVLAHRFFLALRGSELFKNKAKAKWTEKINKKLEGNSFVSHIEITDISLGEYAPKIHGVRLLKGMPEDLAVQAELDVTYNGGGSIAIQTTLVGGLKLPVRVYLSALGGKLRLRCPSIKWADMVGVAFVEDPGVSFRIDSPITVGENELLRGMVNKLLSGVVRKVFLELWVLPSWRTFFMPLMEPKLEDILARQKAAKEAASTPTRKNLGIKATTLWESRSALLRHSKNGPALLLGDALETTGFPTSTILTPSTSDVADLEDRLVTGFLKLAKDHDTTDTIIPPSVLNQDTLHIDATTDSEKDNSSSATDSDTIKPHSVATPWKTIRNRQGINLQKKRVLINDEVAEVTRAEMVIQCDAERVFSVLSNPEHYRHVDESYVGSEIVHQFDDARGIRHTSYNFGRQGERSFTTFVVKRKSPQVQNSKRHDSDTDSISTTASAPSTLQSGDEDVSYIVVSRSIGDFMEDGGSVEKPAEENEGREDVGLPGQTGEVKDKELETGNGNQSEADKPDAQHEKRSEPFSSQPTASGVKNEKGTEPSPSHFIAPEVKSEKGKEPSPSKPTPPTPNVITPAKPTVYLHGYLIIPSATSPHTSANVTVISQYSADLSRLEISFDSCKKLKGFIEELANLSGLADAAAVSRGTDAAGKILFRQPSDLSATLRRRRFFSDSATDGHQGRKLDKIKNFVGSTAGFLVRRGKEKGLQVLGGRKGELSRSGSSELGSPGGVEMESFAHGNEGEDILEEESVKDDGESSLVSTDTESTTVHDVTGGEQSHSSVTATSAPPPMPPRPSKQPQDTHPLTTHLSIHRNLAPRETARVEIPFTKSLYPANAPTVFAWEVSGGQYHDSQSPSRDGIVNNATQQKEQQINFSVSFIPDGEANDIDIDTLGGVGDTHFTDEKGILHALPGHLIPGQKTRTEYYIFPSTTVYLSSSSQWGVIDIGKFPSGMLVLVFENGERRVGKGLDYKADIASLDGDGGIMRGVKAEVGVGRKAVWKVPVVVTPEEDWKDLTWDISVGGSFDVLVGVLYEGVEVGVLKGKEVEDDVVKTSANDGGKEKVVEGEEEKGYVADGESLSGVDLGEKGVIADLGKDIEGSVVEVLNAAEAVCEAVGEGESSMDVKGEEKSEFKEQKGEIKEQQSEMKEHKTADVDEKDNRTKDEVGEPDVVDASKRETAGTSEDRGNQPAPTSTTSQQQQPPAASSPRPSLSSRLAAAVAGKSHSSGSLETPLSPPNTSPRPPPRPTVTSLLSARLSTPRPTSTTEHETAQYVVPPIKVKGRFRSRLDVGGKPGVYTLVLDNAYSLVVGKRVGVEFRVRKG